MQLMERNKHAKIRCAIRQQESNCVAVVLPHSRILSAPFFALYHRNQNDNRLVAPGCFRIELNIVKNLYWGPLRRTQLET